MKKERAKKYEVSITLKSNNYYIATISFKIGGTKAKRLENSGTSEYLALLGLLKKIIDYIDMSLYNGLITCKFDDNVLERLFSSITNIGITTPEIIEKTYLIANKINSINANILNNINPLNNYLPFHESINPTNTISIMPNNINIENKNLKNVTEKTLIKDFAINWIKYKFSLCQKTDDNVKPLSKKTIDGYYKILTDNILPYCQKNKKLYLSELTEDFVKLILKNVNGQTCKKNTYIVLNMLFKYAIASEKIKTNPLDNIDKPIQLYKTEEEKLNDFIESDKQYIWLDKFEEENTDMAILFETMLLTGIRPEEACGLKWSAIDLNNNELIINNAYKDFIVYDNNMKPIGHIRHDDKLKTSQSNRRIPLHPRLINILLKHKENQKKLFKTSIAIKKHNRKWSENEYMFLGRTYKPYVASTLSSGLPKFCDKYNLKRITPYGLRHSYATYCSENGMEEIVLMRLMGHTSFQTTQQYYIKVSSKRKRLAMQQAYNTSFYEKIV